MKEKSFMTKARRLRKKLYSITLALAMAATYLVFPQSTQAVNLSNLDSLFGPHELHTVIEHTSKLPTKSEDGYMKYYFCQTCNIYYLDKSGKYVVTEYDIVIPATGHDLVNGVYYDCYPYMGSVPMHAYTSRCTIHDTIYMEMKELCNISGDRYNEHYERISNSTQHSYYYCKTCSRCGRIMEYCSETQGCSDNDGDWYCDLCGNYLHPHSMTSYEAKAPGLCQSGNSAYYYCGVCNKYYSDATGQNEIEKDSWIIPVTEHDWENYVSDRCDYNGDDTHHWRYYCTTCKTFFYKESEPCEFYGVKSKTYQTLGKGKHSYIQRKYCFSCGHEKDFSEEQECSYGEWTVTKEASYTEEGKKVRTCSYCKGEEEMSIPKLEGLKIVTQPSDYNGKIGDSAAFTVEAAGEGLTYQWYYSKDGNRWSKSTKDGCNSCTLNVAFNQARVNQMYRCLVTDQTGMSVTTESVRLILKNSQLSIVTQPADFSGSIGETATFTVETTGNVASYQWYYSKDNGAKWSRSGLAGYDTATLSVPVNNARMGQMYRCVITDEEGNTVTSDAAAIKQKQSGIVITSQPVSAEVALRTTATFTVEAQGDSLEYQWYYSKDNGDTWSKSGMTGNNTTSLQVKAIASRNGQMYRCRITDANGAKEDTRAASITIK